MNEPRRTDDSAARRAIEGELEATLFVEAGAGTGKTSELVARVLALAASGNARLGELAAITFTEAAAADLRERIHDELLKKAASPGGGWARSALHELDNASMTTIHGFAQRILLEHPLSAGLPLRIRVLDEIRAATDFERRFGAFLDALLDDAASEALITAALAIGVTLGHLRQLATEIDAAWDRHREPGPGSGLTVERLAAEVDGSSRALIDAMRALGARRGSCRRDADTLVALLGRIEADLDRASRLSDWRDRLEWLCSLGPWKPGNKGRKGDWNDVDVADVRAEVVAVDEMRSVQATRLREVVLDALVRRLGAGAVAAAEQRRRTGELYFHDLLVFARDLLANDAGVRAAVSARYSHILVDEFQDTDPIQLEIVRLLGRDATGGAVPGKLFFVGDPRQSIYRFRGAEPELYAAAMRELVPSGPVRLTTNFRSVPGVIDWVNGVFAPLFAPAADPDPAEADGPGYTPLKAHRRPDSGVPVVVLGAEAGAKLSAHDRRVRESADIAAVITLAVRDGWPVEHAVRDASRWVRGRRDPRHPAHRARRARIGARLRGHPLPGRLDLARLLGTRGARLPRLCAGGRFPGRRGGDHRRASDADARLRRRRSPALPPTGRELESRRPSGRCWRRSRRPGNRPPRAIAARRHRLGVVATLEEVARAFQVSELAALDASRSRGRSPDPLRRRRGAGLCGVGRRLDCRDARVDGPPGRRSGPRPRDGDERGGRRGADPHDPRRQGTRVPGRRPRRARRWPAGAHRRGRPCCSTPPTMPRCTCEATSRRPATRGAPRPNSRSWPPRTCVSATWR